MAKNRTPRPSEPTPARLRTDPTPKPNPAWCYSPPRSGWITVDGRRVAVVEVDACAIAPLLPPPLPRGAR